MAKITSEQLEIVIYSLSRPNGGGADKFVKEHAVELAALLEEFVLPEIKKKEAVDLIRARSRIYEDEYYDVEEERIWDGFGD